MSVRDRWLSVVKEIREGAAKTARFEVARAILVGPYDGAGIEKPGEEKGPGFAIFIGEWRIGWWKTRYEACEEAEKLGAAIREHPIQIGLGDA